MPNFEELTENLAELGSGFALAFLLLLAVWGVYLLLSRMLSMAGRRRRLPEPMIFTLRKLLRWGAVVVAILLVLQAFGVLGSAMTAVAGLFALVAIGFVAVWSVLSNTLCSLMLLITRPFQVGDVIRFPTDNVEGKVVNFNMVFTTLKGEDSTMIEVPNNLFFQRLIVRVPNRDKQVDLGEQLYVSQDANV